MKTYRGSRFRRYRGYRTDDDRIPRRYRRNRKRRSGVRFLVSVGAVLLVVSGLVIVGYSLLLGEDALVPRAVETATESEDLAASAPEDTTLELTVPKMARVEGLPVYDAPWDDEAALDVSAAHLDSTGFPWEEGANVYIAGHRMGFPGTESFLVFYDLDVLESGDEIFLTDSEGTRYSYEVFDTFISDPYDWSSTEPVPGKSVITLQTCTLPDYEERLIVQAELTETTPGAESPREESAEPKEAEPEEETPDEAEPVAIPQYEAEPVAIPQYAAEPEFIPPEEISPEFVPPEEVVPEFVPPEEVAPEAIPQGEVPPEPGLPPEQAAPVPQGAAPAVVAFYPFLFFALRGRRSAARRSTGAPPLRCSSTISGTPDSERPTYQVPFGSDPS